MKVIDKTPLQNEKGKTASTWENVDLSNLSVTDKTILETARQKYGDKYQNKLIADFSLGVVKDKDLKLKDTEWNLLNKHVGDRLEAEIRARGPEGEKLLNEMKKAGKGESLLSWISLLVFCTGLGTLENTTQILIDNLNE